MRQRPSGDSTVMSADVLLGVHFEPGKTKRLKPLAMELTDSSQCWELGSSLGETVLLRVNWDSSLHGGFHEKRLTVSLPEEE